MAAYILYADSPEKRRDDNVNVVAVSAADAASARQAARDLIGDPGDPDDHPHPKVAFEDFQVTQISASDLDVGDFAIQGHGPVGKDFLKLTTGGNTLA